MTLSVDVIKRDRRSESFDRDKLHRSIVATCLSVRAPEGQADNIAASVCESVMQWLEDRPEITSNDLRLVACRKLRVYHPDAAYLYEQHHITI